MTLAAHATIPPGVDQDNRIRTWPAWEPRCHLMEMT